MVYSHIKYSDKPFMGSVTAPERAEDSVAMAKLVFGDEFVENNCVMLNLINANSPMVFDETMLGAAKVYARHGQASVISPFILSGAMSPVTVAGTLTQILAEVLAVLRSRSSSVRGAPVLFGTFAASISMQSGAPTFGTPEPALVSYGAAQLARRMGLPFGPVARSVRPRFRMRRPRTKRQYAQHDPACRCELRVACGWMARGWSCRLLREVHDRPGSARHDAEDGARG